MRLIIIDQEMEQALDDRAHFAALYGDVPIERLELVRGVVEQTLLYQEVIDATEPWCGYLCARPEDGVLIGSGGFKGVPDEAGTVEIAYYIFADFEGAGLGLATARTLFEVARDAGASAVVAHTLPEPSASTSILTRLGFERMGDRMDPEDGLVWRWERDA